MADTQKPIFCCTKVGRPSLDENLELFMEWAAGDFTANDSGGDRQDAFPFVIEFFDTTEKGSHCPTIRYFAGQGNHDGGIIFREIENAENFRRNRYEKVKEHKLKCTTHKSASYVINLLEGPD